MVEQFVFRPDGTFSYTGEMDKAQMVAFINRLMRKGIEIDVERGLQRLMASGFLTPESADRIRAKVERAFSESNEIYGQLVFSTVCDGRVTGHMGGTGQFNMR